MQLIDIRMHDGSRHFLTLPESEPWRVLRDHLALLSGVEVTDFLTDGVTEAWIDFAFSNHCFTANSQFGEYWFFVNDPSCPAEILNQVARHCVQLLGS